MGRLASASFFAPWDRTVEPYIRVSTGEYPQLVRNWDDGTRYSVISFRVRTRSPTLVSG
jgi:hypothetical protein